MSTNLVDLPGPPEEIQDIPEYTENNSQHNENYEHYEHYEDSPITKTHLSSSNNILDIITNETTINYKDNLLLLLILFISTLRYSDEYTRKIMSVLNFSITNLTFISLIKSLLLLLLYILCKNYILPIMN